jgi:hypothetical protein
MLILMRSLQTFRKKIVKSGHFAEKKKFPKFCGQFFQFQFKKNFCREKWFQLADVCPELYRMKTWKMQSPKIILLSQSYDRELQRRRCKKLLRH